MPEPEKKKPGTTPQLSEDSVLKALGTMKLVQEMMDRTGQDVVELFASALATYDKCRRETDDYNSKIIFRRPDGEEIEFDILGH